MKKKCLAWVMTLALLAGLLPGTAWADSSHDIGSGTLTISSGGTYAVTGTTTAYQVVVNTKDDVTLILSSVSIDLSGQTSGSSNSPNFQSAHCPIDLHSAGNVTIQLTGTNTLTAGAQAPGLCAPTSDSTNTSNKLTINGAGSLSATGTEWWPGIGIKGADMYCNIVIEGGTITATGGNYGAGIGGGHSGSKDSSYRGKITINGGTVTATGGQSGAGIGGGNNSYGGGTIAISGGTVTATGGDYGAGIGGGNNNYWGGDIAISGGVVVAQGSSTAQNIGTGRSNNGIGPINKTGGLIFEGDQDGVIGDGSTGQSATITSDFTIPSGKTVTIASGQTLTVSSGVTLTNNGTITNNGAIVNFGTISGTTPGGNVGAPNITVNGQTFAAEFGYTPTAQAITLTNTGTIVATISTVEVNGDFQIGGSGSSVPASGSISSWTITPNANLSAGTYNGIITVTYNGGKTATAQVSFTVKPKPEATPGAGIDYTNEKLTGLVTNANYAVNGTDKPADASGTIPMEAGWMGSTVSIVRKATDSNHADSAAQSLTIPGRPAAPTGTTACSIENATGIITINSGYEVNTAADFTGTSVTSGYTITPGVPLYARKAATNSSFTSGVQTITPEVYLDASGAQQWAENCAALPDGTAWGTAGQTTWYVASGAPTVNGRITVSGDVRLILADGCALTASSGIAVNDGNSLTVYAQSTGESMGKLIATNPSEGGAAIGANKSTKAGSVTINGGEITATVNNGGGACIGQGGWDGAGGSVTINGGLLTLSCSAGDEGAFGGGTTLSIQNAFVDVTNKTGTINESNIHDALLIKGSSGQVYGSYALARDYTVANGKTLTIPEGATLTVDGGKTLTVDGTVTNNGTLTGAVRVKVSFDANGGSVTETSRYLSYPGTYGTLPTPTLSNNRFLGWYTSSGDKVTESDAVPLAGTTLYAHWTALTVTGGTEGTDYEHTADGALRILTNTALTVSGTSTTEYILVDGSITANLTLNGLTITSTATPFDIMSGTVNLTLADGTTNSFTGGEGKAGIHVLEGASLVIGGSGTLNATGAAQGAGIGGDHTSNAGNITINDGTIVAKSTGDGAGLGGGHANDEMTSNGENRQYGKFQSITINGGHVTAESAVNGAGIGCGCWARSMGTLTITGGEIHAKSGSNAGCSYDIGYGHNQGYSAFGAISITGGVIYTEGSHGRDIGAQTVTQNGDLHYDVLGNKITAHNYTLTSNLEIPSGKTLVIPEGESLTINDGVTLTVGSGNVDARGTTNNNGAIVKRDQTATPTTPTVSAQTDTGVTLNTISLNGGIGSVKYGYAEGSGAANTVNNWQDSAEFTGLQAATAYTFYAEYTGNEYYNAAYSTGASVSTAAVQPAADAGYTIDFAAETATPDSGYEISTDNSVWQTGALSITPGGKLYVRMAQSGSIPASASRENTLPARPDTPSGTITVSKTQNSVTITNPDAFTGCEFSIDGTSWQDTMTFSGLSAGTAYTVSARLKATASAFHSDAVTRSVTTVNSDNSTTVSPGESAVIGETTITTDGTKTTITKDATTTAVTPSGSTTTVTGGKVEVPNGSTVQTGSDPAITLPSGGKVEGGGTVTADTVQIGYTTITGTGMTVAPDGTATVPANGTVQTGSNPAITLPDGGTAQPDGTTTTPAGGKVQIGDTTITAPAGGTVTTAPDGTSTVPDGTTVKTGDKPTITVGPGNGGTVAPDGGVSVGGGKVTVSGTSDTTTITAPDGGATIKPSEDGTIPLPGGATVQTGSGEPVVVPSDGGVLDPATGEVEVKYTVTVVNGTGGGAYYKDATVTITANAAPGGQMFNGWTSPDGVTFASAGSQTTSFTMPEKNVTVTATYRAIPTYTLSVSAPTFDAVKEGYAQPEEKAITITSTGNSAATISSVTLGGADAGAFVLANGTASVAAGGTNTSYTIQPNAGLAVGAYTATITVTYNGGRTATATVSFTVNALEVVATPAFDPAAGAYMDSVDVTISCATDGATIRFTTDGTEPDESSPAYDGVYTVSADTVLKAVAFKDGMAKSAVATAAYTITPTPPTVFTLTLTNGTGGGEYTEGAEVTITANPPETGKRFKEWTGADGLIFTSGSAVSATATFTMPTRNLALTATYEEIPTTTYTATVVNGTGGGSYAADATVTIRANAAPSGKVFDRWTSSDGVTFANAYSSVTTFTMPAKDVTVKATYRTEYTPYDPGNYVYRPTYTPTVSAEHGAVTISPRNPERGDMVTITVTPDAGYEVDAFSVTDASGKSVNVKDNRDGTYTFTQPGSRVTIKVIFKAAQAVPMTDVFDAYADLNSGAWYAEGIRYVIENGIMKGVGGGKFAPDATATRAQIAQLLFNLDGATASGNLAAFSDVHADNWYANPVTWMVENGIASGMGNSFGANMNVTREQLAVMLYNYAKYKGYDVSISGSVDAFTDSGDVSDWARAALAWAVGAGLINGMTDGSSNVVLKAQGNATRAQIAAIIMRFCELVAK